MVYDSSASPLFTKVASELLVFISELKATTSVDSIQELLYIVDSDSNILLSLSH